jgi:hypothetical protein
VDAFDVAADGCVRRWILPREVGGNSIDLAAALFQTRVVAQSCHTP